MPKTIIRTNRAPAPIGPYSQAVRAGDFLFCSGQIPLHPDSGNVVAGDVKAQTRQVVENIRAVLEQAGANFNNVVKSTIFLKDMNEFPQVNEVYGEFFKGETPARSTVQVARLPKDVNVEIEVIAYLGK